MLEISIQKNSRNKSPVGWEKLRNNVEERLRQLTQSEFVSRDVRDRAEWLINSIVDGRMERVLVAEALRLLQSNRLPNKKKREKIASDTSKFTNAIVYACQACENLIGIGRDADVNQIQNRERDDIVARLNASVLVLMEIQKRIIQERVDDEQG